MSTHDTLRSFQDLDAAHFRKNRDASKIGTPAGKRAPAPPVALPAVEDESALFLEAVSGTLDVSLKHTPGDADTPAPPAGKKTERPIASPSGRESLPSPQQPEAAVPVSPQPPGAPKDAALFAEAMGGVRPIRASGREVAPPVKPLEPSHAGTTADMDALFNGAIAFSLEYTDEFVQGHVVGLDPLALDKLKAGAYSPEGHVDLHGHNMEQAYAVLSAFIRHAYQSGKRNLIVITGRGKNSPGGTPVLRERVQTWFTRDPFKRVILAFCSAKPGDGGVGALYVLLRKRKKSQGKIIWNHVPSEEELLL